MRLGLVLAAVLWSEAVFAFPYPGLAPFEGKALLPRMGGDHRGSSHSGSGGHRDGKHRKPATGYEDEGYYHHDAPARKKKTGHRVANLAKQHKYDKHESIPRYRDDDGPRGKTSIREEYPPNEPPIIKGLASSDQMGHKSHYRYRSDLFGEFEAENARYSPESSPQPRRRRAETIGGKIPKKSQLESSDSDSDSSIPSVDIDEAPGTQFKLENANAEQLDTMPFTSGSVPTKESRKKNAPINRQVARRAKEVGGHGAFGEKDKDIVPPPFNPMRGPWHPDHGKPADERFERDHAVRRRRRRRRSDSPDRRSDDIEWRDFVIVSGVAASRQSKRDVTDMASEQESHGESSHPAKPTTFKQDYEQYLEDFNVVRNNASDIIMPFIEEMVNGSTSELVWDAAWEIMSLADPNIQVMGPVYGGMHCFDWIEEQIVNTTDEATMTSVYQVHGVLEAMYLETWNKANDTLTATGIFDELEVLEQVLETNDTLLASMDDTQTTKETNNFFLNGPNSTIPAVEIDNSTSSTGNKTIASADNMTFQASNNTDVPVNISTAPTASETNLPTDKSTASTGNTTTLQRYTSISSTGRTKALRESNSHTLARGVARATPSAAIQRAG